MFFWLSCSFRSIFISVGDWGIAFEFGLLVVAFEDPLHYMSCFLCATARFEDRLPIFFRFCFVRYYSVLLLTVELQTKGAFEVGYLDSSEPVPFIRSVYTGLW